jgi:AraC-like DNA-binding protein
MTGRARVNTVSNAYLRGLLDHVQARGLEPARLLAGAGLALDDRDGRVTEAQAADLFDRAAALLDDPALGLHAGEGIRPGHYGALGYVAMNCATLAEALDSLRRYQSLVIDLGEVGMKMEADTVVLSWQPDTERPYRQLAEFNLAGLLTFTRWMAGRDAQPAWIELAYPAPADLHEHARVFGCDLRFDRPHYRLALPQAWLRAPLIQPDPAMRELMQRLADQQLRALPREGEDLLARARGLIARQLKQPPVELDGIATQLATSPRSLQRRLAEAGLSFSQLTEQVRRELAERYLQDASMNLTDIAFLLGYSEQSAFQRAFKRWSGQTPAQFRAQAAARSSG